MLLESGTTSQITNRSYPVRTQQKFNAPVYPVDDSTVTEMRTGTRIVR